MARVVPKDQLSPICSGGLGDLQGQFSHLNVHLVVRWVLHHHNLVSSEAKFGDLPEDCVPVGEDLPEVRVSLATVSLPRSRLVILGAHDNYGELLVVRIVFRLADRVNNWVLDLNLSGGLSFATFTFFVDFDRVMRKHHR